MRKLFGRLIMACSAAAIVIAGAGVRAEEPFPAASPTECNLSADAIDLLAEHIGQIVASDSVVGAEVHVIKDRKTVFHQAYGWADRDDHRRLEIDSIYCVRSMTKPLVGTAIQMLIDDGMLSLDQRVAEILSEFDLPAKRAITIQHLLTHTSGLPMSTIGRPLAEYQSLRDVAIEAAEAALEFKPGTSFQYSDAGSDTLGAIVAAVSGMPAEKFIADRIVQPLDMQDTLMLIGGNDPRERRIPSAYSGGAGNWQRHWRPSERPMFPFFLTSQSLYCTTTDYARFLALWMDGGVSNGQALLSQDAVQRALAPGWRISEYPTGFEHRVPTYGQQWMVYKNEDADPSIIFGHGGSDGTHAWVWPQEDLIVLFFTQSRGTLAGVELESAIDRLLIKKDIAGFRRDMLAKAAAQKSFKRYEGIYWDEDVDTDYYVVAVDDDRLVLERPGRFRAVVSPQADEGKFASAAGVIKIAFDLETDPSSVMLMTTPKRTERQVRHERDLTLPSIDDVIARVRKAHAIDQLRDAGVIKLSGTIKMGLLRRERQIRQWFDSRRSRTEIDMGETTITVITNGNDAAASTAGGVVERLVGLARQQETLAHPSIQFGGWRRGYVQLDVLKRFEREEGEHFLVRARATGSPDATIIVNADTGLIVGEHRLQSVPGVGFVGLTTSYSDFREVAGMTIPFHTESKFANPLLGKVVVQIDASEIDTSESNRFDLPES